MATSGSTSKAVTDWDTLVFSWTLKSQSIPGNTSTISWKLQLVASKFGAINSSASKAWTVNVQGQMYGGHNTVGISNNETKTLASGTTTIAHQADGTRTFSYSANQMFDIDFNGRIGMVELEGSGTLPAIRSASQPSLVTWPETTNNVGDFGEEFSIHMNRESSEFTHTVRYEYGKRSGTIATGVATGTTWAVPLEFMNDIPNATSASGRIYVDTYVGNVLVGTKYTGFTVTVPASVKPGCSLKLEDISGVGDIYGVPVQGLSKIKITVNTTPAYKSAITSYLVKANGATYTEAVSTTDALKAAGSSPITATVTDQRGRTNTASYTMNVLAYTPPSISSLTVHRCNENGTENDQGEFVRVVFSAAITSLNAKNTATYTLRYKKSNEITYTEVPLGSLANVYTVTSAAHIFAADSSNSYDVEVEAKDRHGSATRSTSASTAFTLINWGADGSSMGIGKVAEKANTLQIALDVEFIGKVSGAIFDAIYPVGSIYLAYNHTDPSTLFGGTWTRMTDGFLWASKATDIIGQTGGEKTHTLTVDELPEHNHGGTYTNGGDATKTHAWLASGGSAMAYESVDAGGGQAHNNMPPYIQVSIWRRTA
jgi:hypothetical protein